MSLVKGTVERRENDTEARDERRLGHELENKLSPSVWKDTEPKVHVLIEAQGGTEGKREEARGDERQGRSALRLG